MGAPRERLRLNRTGIPLEAFPFENRPVPADGAWQFVQACRLIAKKGLRTSLRAFARFRERWPSAKFVLAGDGPMRAEVEKMAAEMELGGAVELRGFLDQAGLAKLYAESHVFLHPSEMTEDKNQEGVPNSMLEAMATGLPVAATLHGGIPEAVTDGTTGFLVEERDDEALAGALLRLAADGALWSRMGAAAAQSVREEFSQTRAIEKLEGFYDEAKEAGK
jgi:glycosyltransferase involved in cell wall biosynthesis